VTQRDAKTKKPQWSNPHAQIMGQIHLIDPSTVRLFEPQPKDKQYGEVGDLYLRYLGRINALDREIKQVNEILDGEHDLQRKEHFYTGLDSLVRELEVVLGLYTEQFDYEPSLLEGWKGPPIFTIRTGGIVVIRDDDLKRYRTHLLHAPPRRLHAHDVYLYIALQSLKRE
jgi:hypothetical protein